VTDSRRAGIDRGAVGIRAAIDERSVTIRGVRGPRRLGDIDELPGMIRRTGRVADRDLARIRCGMGGACRHRRRDPASLGSTGDAFALAGESAAVITPYRDSPPVLQAGVSVFRPALGDKDQGSGGHEGERERECQRDPAAKNSILGIVLSPERP
jgi:hypothetical protein